jgi:hypothetical protein
LSSLAAFFFSYVRVNALLQSPGIMVELLAPYAPTSNPIEDSFSKVKA